ncbi:MAG: 2-isopropylmalate synthase [Lachnospiraceae bacterium]|nr:2-isopropylmalate synthase [Lachnospiraceae bacterium]MBR6486067.1 2-isopropylmalate synthase [Lachnospiraceae bacterium]
MLNVQRYRKNPVLHYPERQWPDKEIEKAPIWCSVDLRDGNQALIDPMIVEEKLEFFEMLIKLGFKEIEIGFPAASQIEYDFLRQLVDRRMIPDDVWVQVLTQCREELIDRTFESIQGIKNVIVHIYNSTSVLQRDVVFNMDKEQIIGIAVNGTKWVKERAEKFDGNIRLEYSPESFTGTEVEFSLEICEAVLKTWGATKDDPVIINLPATVEMNTPNVYADQIEWVNKHFSDRDSVILSVHPHNDRGTGIAATELALLAGADRVEGTLFGNGERTGNIDVLNVAYNMFSQGIDPMLNIEKINDIIEVYERLVKMPIDDRHPYAGKLVFTAFSGSHQDAINKGVKAMKERKSEIWQVPYLPIDPSDIGREYEPIVRINSQSGKGGVAFIMDTYFGFKLPKGMHKEFAKVIQAITEKQGEISPDEIMAAFKESYIDMKEPLHFRKLKVDDQSDSSDSEFDTHIMLTYTEHDKEESFEAVGNGPIDAVLRGLKENLGLNIKVLDYEEHALQGGANAQAAAYIHLLNDEDGSVTYGVGVSSNITRASVRAMFSAINRLGLIK